MINKNDLRKAISSIAISNAKRNTIYKAFSDLASITKEEFDSVKSDISKVVESMLTKDTVGKANGVASLDSNGSVPIEQLGNIDTMLFLIVRELPTTDIKSNKIYLVPNQDGQGNNVYIEYLYVENVWEKLGEFKPEVDLSHILEKLDNKADKVDVDNRLNDLQNYCFKLGDNGQVAAPYKTQIFELGSIRQLNDNEYNYAIITTQVLMLDTTQQYYIYDKTINETVKITKLNDKELDYNGNFFRTAEPIDLTHTFYIDNEKTGVVENLTQLTIEENNVFTNIPYVYNNFDNEETFNYIYDANDNKWIEVVECFYTSSTCYCLNTEKPLDLTHDFYYCNNPDIITNNQNSEQWYTTMFGYNAAANNYGAIAIGYNATANGTNAIAIDFNSRAEADNSIAIGFDTLSNGNDTIVIGNSAIGKSYSSISIGYYTKTESGNNIAIGCQAETNNENTIAIGYYSKAKFISSLALGCNSKTGGDYAIALGENVSNTKSIFGVGFNGVNGIDMDRDNYGLYLKGFGNYNGTNLVIKDGNTETLNPDIKSVQQIINEKADASAIPTKLSQLTNDANFITSYTETDPVWTNEKGNYYTKTEIDNKGYLTAHQSLDAYAKKTEIPNVSTKADLVNGKLKAEQLPKLVNITTASTAEEVVTKFNALLADLKAKGYMEADIAQ